MDRKKHYFIRLAGITALLILAAGVNNVSAFKIPTANPDWSVRLDNTVKYNYGVRLESPDPVILATINSDDGDRNFSKGTITNRLDLLSELDIRYKRKYAFRISGAAWYDQRYNDPLDNDSLLTSNHLKNGEQALGLSDDAKRYHRGPYAELLDCFVSANMDLWSFDTDVKVGRNTQVWGEAMMTAVHSIAYAQFPLDSAKGAGVPGSEVKELYRPLGNITVTSQLTDNLMVAGQYFFEWEPWRLPEPGSYWANGDPAGENSESMLLAPGVFLKHGNDIEPESRKDYGFMLGYATGWLPGTAGTIGLYYRRVADKLPTAILNLDRNEYVYAYADDIRFLQK